MSSTRIMAHMVPYFPDLDTSRAALEGLVAGGVTYLEIQFPFSDPSADGPTIQGACSRALERGFSVSRGFEFIETASSAYKLPIYLMTYASIPVAYGMERFLYRAATAGVSGIIAPDLPPDYDEGLYATARSAGLSVVPVLAPSVTKERIALVRQTAPEMVYAALRSGTTGQETSIGEENLAFLKRLQPIGAPIVAGFGIRRPSQVEALRPHVHAVVVGSLLVQAIDEEASAGPDAVRERLRQTVAGLAGREGAEVS